MKTAIKLFLLFTLLASCAQVEPDDVATPALLPTHALGYQPGEYGDTLKILAIGNSFAQDAVEQNLHEMLEEAGIPSIIGCLYRPSCTLAMHASSIRYGSSEYGFSINTPDGNGSKFLNMSIPKALALMDWDIVTLQQESSQSGIFNTYGESLPFLTSYIRDMLDRPVWLGWHQTWAYGPDYDRSKFGNYNWDQLTMYNSILESSTTAVRCYDLDLYIPSGTAVQEARQTSLGNDLTRDGMHLDWNAGRYLAACAWFEAITGLDVREISYMPARVSSEDGALARECAHNAVAQFKYLYAQDED